MSKTFVVVSAIIAAANRGEDFRANLRDGFTNAGLVGRAAQSVKGVVAEFTDAALEPLESTADIGDDIATNSVVIDVYARAISSACIAVRFAIAAAHRGVLPRAGLWDVHAEAR